MKLEDIIDEARKDILKKDEIDLDDAALKISSILQKWNEILTKEKIHLRKLHREFSKWKKVLWEYYNGKLSPEDHEKYNLEPFALKILKKDYDVYFDSDPIVADFYDSLSLQEEKISFIERKLKDISSWQWLIRAAIDHRKFMSGG